MYSYRLVSKSNVFSFNLVHRSNSASLLVTGGAIRGRFTHFCFIDNAFYVLPSTVSPPSLLSHRVYHQIKYPTPPLPTNQPVHRPFVVMISDLGSMHHLSYYYYFSMNFWSYPERMWMKWRDGVSVAVEVEVAAVSIDWK